MSDHCCPACGSSSIVMTDDFERDLTILKCRGPIYEPCCGQFSEEHYDPLLEWLRGDAE